MDQTIENLTVTGKITVKHPKSDIGVSIVAMADGAGIWIGEKTFVAIHNIAGQVCLALSREDPNGRTFEGHAFAISIDTKTGEPSIQLCRPNGRIAILTGDELESLLKGAKGYG